MQKMSKEYKKSLLCKTAKETKTVTFSVVPLFIGIILNMPTHSHHWDIMRFSVTGETRPHLIAYTKLSADSSGRSYDRI